MRKATAEILRKTPPNPGSIYQFQVSESLSVDKRESKGLFATASTGGSAASEMCEISRRSTREIIKQISYLLNCLSPDCFYNACNITTECRKST